MWKFSKEEGRRATLISCIYAVGMSCTDMLLYTGVRHCSVYSSEVIPQPSYK